MIIIGVDPHKRMHMASVVEPATNRQVSALKIEASLAGYRRLLKWAGAFSERRWAVENARGLGRHLAHWLVARGEVVDDVSSTATARVRELSRGGRRKNDVIDAAAAASVAALQGEAHPVLAEDLTTVLALLDERRNNVVTQRTRLVNQLHALFRELLPGGAPTDLTATIASRLLAGVRPAGPVEAARKQLARDLVAEIRDADQRLNPYRSDRRHRRRDRQPPNRGRRCRAGRRRPVARTHPTRQPIRYRVGLRQLRRRRPGGGFQRRPSPLSPAPRR
jgi:transposase